MVIVANSEGPSLSLETKANLKRLANQVISQSPKWQEKRIVSRLPKVLYGLFLSQGLLYPKLSLSLRPTDLELMTFFVSTSRVLGLWTHRSATAGFMWDWGSVFYACLTCLYPGLHLQPPDLALHKMSRSFLEKLALLLLDFCIYSFASCEPSRHCISLIDNASQQEN